MTGPATEPSDRQPMTFGQVLFLTIYSGVIGFLCLIAIRAGRSLWRDAAPGFAWLIPELAAVLVIALSIYRIGWMRQKL